MANSVRFPYLQVKNAIGETAWRPILPFKLAYQQQSVQVAGLIDTGADVNVLPYRIGLELGAVWDNQSQTVALSGNMAQYEARGIILNAHVEPFTTPVRLVFAWTRAEHVPLLLGQTNFLIEFRVCFFGYEREFEVTLRSQG